MGQRISHLERHKKAKHKEHKEHEELKEEKDCYESPNDSDAENEEVNKENVLSDLTKDLIHQHQFSVVYILQNTMVVVGGGNKNGCWGKKMKKKGKRPINDLNTA